ncbi:mucoidy inhibitor MuiA family protein [bacterium SCSIO 12741]|nr:mucoidy inhibitor MuiA family protein [bacterium SCSIO 12741]
MKTIISLLLLAPLSLWAKDTLTFSTTIESVRVYLDAAQITRHGSLSLKPGDQLVKIDQLSPWLDPKSVKVKGEGEVQLLSVSHSVKEDRGVNKEERMALLQSRMDSIQDKQKEWKAEGDVLKEKLDLLKINKTRNPESMPDVNQLNQVMEYYDAQMTKILGRQLEISRLQAESMKVFTRIQGELAYLKKEKGKPKSEILLRLRVKEATRFKLHLTYVVGQAGWYPLYDIHAVNVSDPVKITYKARVYQQTGEDWNKVKMTFTNREAQKSGAKPNLSTWKLNYERYTTRRSNLTAQLTQSNVRKVMGKVTDENGEALPFVNILVRGMTIGTTTDFDGLYEITLPAGSNQLEYSFVGYRKEIRTINQDKMDVQLYPNATQLSEVVVTERKMAAASIQRIPGVTSSGYKRDAAPVRTQFMDRYNSAEFELEGEFTLETHGQSEVVELKDYSIPATYEYYVVPKLDVDVFLMARITDWGNYGFLPGEASLYFEETFIGKSVFDTRQSSDTLNLSLGTDPGVFAAREIQTEFSKVRTVGNNHRIDTRGISLSIRNNKRDSISVQVIDQIPVSVNNAIQVSLIQSSEAQYTEYNGRLYWPLNLSAGESEELTFQYQVKYPKTERIILE